MSIRLPEFRQPPPPPPPPPLTPMNRTDTYMPVYDPNVPPPGYQSPKEFDRSMSVPPPRLPPPPPPPPSSSASTSSSAAAATTFSPIFNKAIVTTADTGMPHVKMVSSIPYIKTEPLPSCTETSNKAVKRKYNENDGLNMGYELQRYPGTGTDVSLLIGTGSKLSKYGDATSDKYIIDASDMNIPVPTFSNNATEISSSVSLTQNYPSASTSNRSTPHFMNFPNQKNQFRNRKFLARQTQNGFPAETASMPSTSSYIQCLQTEESKPYRHAPKKNFVVPSEMIQPLYCKLCEVRLNGTLQADAHYEGRIHKKRERYYIEKLRKEQGIKTVYVPQVANNMNGKLEMRHNNFGNVRKFFQKQHEEALLKQHEDAIRKQQEEAIRKQREAIRKQNEAAQLMEVNNWNKAQYRKKLLQPRPTYKQKLELTGLRSNYDNLHVGLPTPSTSHGLYGEQVGSYLSKAGKFQDRRNEMKKEKDEMFCKVCGVAFNSLVQAKQHYTGRNHERRVRGEPPLPKGFFNPVTGKWQRQPPLPPPDEPEMLSPIQKKQHFICTLCNHTMTTQTQLDAHLIGAKHKFRVAQAERKPETTRSSWAGNTAYNAVSPGKWKHSNHAAVPTLNTSDAHQVTATATTQPFNGQSRNVCNEQQRLWYEAPSNTDIASQLMNNF